MNGSGLAEEHAPSINDTSGAAAARSGCGEPVVQDEMRRALQDVLASRTFSRAERLRGLLQFVAEEVLAGRGSDLNEYKIGVEALGRPAGYSPLEDSSVRSRIYEVRKKLDRYYSRESPDADVRIVLPKGSHAPEFVRTQPPEPKENIPSDQAHSPTGWDKLLNRNVTGSFAAGALVVLLVASLLGNWTPSMAISRSLQGPAANVSLDGALEELWGPLLDPAQPLLILFELRMFFNVGDLAVRDSTVNSLRETPDSEPLMRVQDLFQSPIYESRNYTDSGTPHVTYLLGRLLSDKTLVSIKDSSSVTGDDWKGQNIVFIGKPTIDPTIRTLLAQGPITNDPDGVRISDPRAGEQAEYLDSTESPYSEKYALVSMLPGFEPGARVLALTGGGTEHPRALAQYMTSPDAAEELVKHLRLPSGRLPDFYQIVVRAQFQSYVPVSVSYVTHRIVK